MARWKYVVAVVAGVPLLATGLFAGWVWAAFSGGLDDLVDLDKPRPGDAEVVAAEQRARDRVGAAVADLDETLVSGADASVIGGGLARPRCDVGQHNFKRDDDFDLVCELTWVQVVTAPSVDAAVAESAVDDALRADGWSRSSGGGGTTVGAVDLSPRSYTRTVDGLRWRLVIDEADLSSATSELTARGVLRDGSGRRTTVEELVAGTPREGYAVIVGLSVEYFRD